MGVDLGYRRGRESAHVPPPFVFNGDQLGSRKLDRGLKNNMKSPRVFPIRRTEIKDEIHFTHTTYVIL